MTLEAFPLTTLDYLAIGGFFAMLSVVGFLAGRGEQAGSTEYFLAGKKLPWYVVGGSFIASNISSEQFIGMIGSAVVFGICVSMLEWGNVVTFTLLIWFFIPFLLSARVFTTPEYLELRYNAALRQLFAVVTVISNVVAFLAAVLYGGALALQNLFGWDLWFAVIALGIVSGVWAIYGGLSSVAWTDLLTVVVMIVGGLTITVLGLSTLAGDDGSLVDGLRMVVERNQATQGTWAEAVSVNLHHLTGGDSESYNRLSLFQGATHPIVPAISFLPFIFSVSVWYNVLNQFMIQRVLGARSEYDARMGIVFAGWIKVFLPADHRSARDDPFRAASGDPAWAVGAGEAGSRQGLRADDPDAGAGRAAWLVSRSALRSDSVDRQLGAQLDLHDRDPRHLQADVPSPGVRPALW